MSEKSDRYWFVLGIAISAFTTVFYEVFQDLLKVPQFDVPDYLIKIAAGALSVLGGIALFFVIRYERKKN